MAVAGSELLVALVEIVATVVPCKEVDEVKVDVTRLPGNATVAGFVMMIVVLYIVVE